VTDTETNEQNDSDASGGDANSDTAPEANAAGDGTATAGGGGESATDENATAGEATSSQPKNAATRRVLAGLFWLLASLAILVSGVTLWAHQTLLTSDGWTRIVTEVVNDEEVIENTSAALVSRLSESLGVGDTVAEILPDQLDAVAGAITLGVEDRVTQAVADFMSREGVQDAFVDVNRAAHDAAMKVIRGGDSEALTSEEGAITLNIFPLIEGALLGLQENGIISEDREIPSLSEYEAPAETVARLEALLGRDLPDDIGTNTLIES
jgi:hypothetical protein